MKKASFREYADLAVSSQGATGLRPVIEKELLHYEILNAMMLEGLYRGITFQGGTSLRLCHGGVRYSEDLDFSGGPGFTAEKAGDIAGAIRHHISERYDLPVQVVPPKDKVARGNDPVTVSTWSIRIETNPGGRNLPSQKIKVDIDTSASLEAVNTNLRLNYDFLPRSYETLIIPTQSMSEIMANKLVALPSSIAERGRPRHRDIWDLRWMMQRDTKMQVDFVRSKAAEHGATGYMDQLELTIGRLPEIMESDDFRNEMSRFLPADTREKSIDRPEWRDVVAKGLQGLFTRLRDELDGKVRPSGLEF